MNMNNARVSNKTIAKNYIPVAVNYINHPNPDDDRTVVEFLDTEKFLSKGCTDTIRLDRKPKPRVLAIAPFAGQGSSAYPMCPFCGTPVECKKHSADIMLSRANLFRQAIKDITHNAVNVEYRSENMDEDYGIMLSGNLYYASDPTLMVKMVLDDLKDRALQQLKNPEISRQIMLRQNNPGASKRIKKLYELLISGKPFTYFFENTVWQSASYEISENIELKNRFAIQT